MFCCGSDTHKYCCTEQDQIIKEEMEGLTIVIGFLVGELFSGYMDLL